MQLRDIADLIDTRVSTERLTADIEAIRAIDRHFTFPKFMESARLSVARMAEAGLDARVLEQPADGATRCGDWVMPMAWDCREATLELLSPEAVRGQMLCRRSDDPNSVVMWCGPTPPGGVAAEIVGPLVAGRPAGNGSKPMLAAPGGPREVRPGELAGKIVYTPDQPRGFKRFLAEAGAAGAVTSFSPARGCLPQNRFWVNGWSDDPDGWAYTARDTPAWCFVLTPEQGRELEALLAAGPVSARAQVDSRIYEGVLPAATGVLPGEGREEILTLGHQFEIGADDSASGCATMLESARVLAGLIREGALPRPARSMRWLMMSECYGSMAFAAANPGIVRRTLAGMNLDCVGGDQRRTEMPLPVSLTPGANPSVADTLIRRLCKDWLRKRDPYFSWFTAGFVPCDSSLSDPAIGIPCVYLGGKDRFWHTTADTIDKIDPQAVARVTVLAASYAYFLAAAGSAEAEWLAEETAADGRRSLARLGAGLAAALRETPAPELGTVLGEAAGRLEHCREVAAARVRSAQKFAARTERREFRLRLRPMVSWLRKQALQEEGYLRRLAARLAAEAEPPLSAPEPRESERPAWWAEAAKLVPVRRVYGAVTLDGVPEAERDGFYSPRWSTETTCVLFRCDGQRTLAEACRLGALDAEQRLMRPSPLKWDYVRFFRLLERLGIVELRPARPPAPTAGQLPVIPHPD